MANNTMPSETDFLVAYSNAKDEEEKAKLKKEYEEQMEAYKNNPNKIVPILD